MIQKYLANRYRCGYCQVDYDVIGKQETFEEDLRFVLRSTGTERPLGPGWEEVRLRRSREPPDGKGLFAALDPPRRRRLRELYEVDFKMFNYSFEGYGVD